MNSPERTNTLEYRPSINSSRGLRRLIMGVTAAISFAAASICPDVVSESDAKEVKEIRATTRERAMRIEVDISDQTLTLMDGNTIIGRYPVSTGRPDTPTELGHFEILEKAEVHLTHDEHLYLLQAWMRFHKGMAIHRVPYRKAKHLIGKKASHGCIRMLKKDVWKVYDQVKVGTPVDIHE